MRKGLSRVGRTIVRVLAVLGMVLVVVTATPLVGWWAEVFAGPWNDPRGEVLVVLGGSMLDHRTLGQSSLLRSNYAVFAYHHDGFRSVLLSGGGTIAESMRDYLEYRGIPATAIRVEPLSTNTRENALYSTKALAGLNGRVVLLTSDYHMFRAYRAFKKAGIDVLPRPIPDVLKRAGSPSERWGAFVDLVRETVAVVYYRARGWI